MNRHGLSISALGILAAVLPAAMGAQAVGDTLQDRIAWLRGHAIPIRTIDPSDTDFSDLAPLAAALNGVRVVLLGEQTHTDGATFSAKARVIEFLHRDAGFDVLAFEANHEAARQLDRYLDGERPLSAASGLTSMWLENSSVQELLAYVRRTRSEVQPLRVSGFDIQFGASGRIEVPELYRIALRDRVRAVAPQLEDSDGVRQVDSILAFLSGQDLRSVTQASYEAAEATVESLRARLSPAMAQDRAGVSARLWRLLDNIVWGLKETNNQVHGPSKPWLAIRDTAMAENLIWLGDQEFPGSRITAWGHWGHFAKNLEGIEILDDSLSYVGEHPMGEHVAKALGRGTYSVGFLAFEGEHGQIFPDTAFIIPIPEPPVGSLDWLLGQLREPYLFLDLRSAPEDHWIRQELIARPGYRDMRARWPTVFDGIIFTYAMFPNDRRPKGSG